MANMESTGTQTNIELSGLKSGWWSHRALRTLGTGFLCFLILSDSGAAVASPALRWRLKAPMLTYRLALAVTAAAGDMYAIGGASPGVLLDAVEAYSPKTNRWSTAAPLPEPRYRLAAATGGDERVYAIGGDSLSSDGTFNTNVQDVDAYDPTSDVWTAVAPMPTGRSLLAATTGPDARIYAIGGAIYGQAVELDIVEAYSPASNTWSSLAPLGTPRYGLAAALGADGRIYAIGGCSDAVPGFSLATVEAYTPSTNTWVEVAPLLTPRCALTAASGQDGRIYAIGGAAGSGQDLTSVEAYSPSTDSWTQVTPTIYPRVESGAAVVGRNICVIGGQATSESLGTIECAKTAGPS
jgi:N-acetylneuraminic acid mutarotase